MGGVSVALGHVMRAVISQDESPSFGSQSMPAWRVTRSRTGAPILGQRPQLARIVRARRPASGNPGGGAGQGVDLPAIAPGCAGTHPRGLQQRTTRERLPPDAAPLKGRYGRPPARAHVRFRLPDREGKSGMGLAVATYHEAGCAMGRGDAAITCSVWGVRGLQGPHTFSSRY